MSGEGIAGLAAGANEEAARTREWANRRNPEVISDILNLIADELHAIRLNQLAAEKDEHES